MAGGGDEAHRFRYVGGKNEVRLQKGLIQRVGQIDLIGAQHLQHPVCRGGAQHQLHLRAQGVVALEQPGQKGGAD